MASNFFEGIQDLIGFRGQPDKVEPTTNPTVTPNEPEAIGAQPIITTRNQLVKELDTLFLAGYLLLKGKSSDADGCDVQHFPLVYLDSETNVTSSYRQTPIRYWLVSDTKIGNDEDVPLPLYPGETILPPEMRRQIRQDIRDEYNNGDFSEDDMEEKEHQRVREAEYYYKNNCFRFIAMWVGGLALITEQLTNEGNKIGVVDFEPTHIDPDEIFAESTTDSQHAELYRQARQLLITHAGEYLPLAPSEARELYQSPMQETDKVDVSNSELDTATLAEICESRGRAGGMSWPLMSASMRSPKRPVEPYEI